MVKDILAIAREAARIGGGCLRALLGKVEPAAKDTTYNLVTAADRRSEELIRSFLAKEDPSGLFYGEESHGNSDLSAGRVWIVDPLDGTTNFIHRIPHFSASVACAENGRILAGAVCDPMRRELFSAGRAEGAFLNGRKIAVSRRSVLSESLIATGFYYDRGATMEKTLRSLHALFKQDIHCVRRMGAATLDLTWLACGRWDGYFEYTLSPWDFAAGLCILEEAGGTGSDTNGTAAGLFSAGLICSNGLIHGELLSCTLDPKPF